MNVSLLEEVRFFLFSALFGILSGALLDVLLLPSLILSSERESPRRLVRVLALFVTALVDLFSVLTVGVLYALLVYSVHRGVLRIYAILALLFGMLLYKKTVGKLLSPIRKRLSHGIRFVVKWLFFPFFFIIKVIFRNITLFFNKIGCLFRNSVLKYKRKRKINATDEKKHSDAVRVYVFGASGRA